MALQHAIVIYDMIRSIVAILSIWGEIIVCQLILKFTR